MDRLWSPWRYQYVSNADPAEGCIFCTKSAGNNDPKHFIVHRARLYFVILNAFPYTTGHLMIVPYQHASSLGEVSYEALSEMIFLAKKTEGHLRAAYRPDGMNLGINIGKSAGAGIAG